MEGLDVYQPYQSTWQNPYLPQGATTLPYQMPQVQPVNGIVTVKGRESALQYQLPPNSISPALFDSDGKVFYVVSTDGTGMRSVEVFDFSPHVDEQPTPPVQAVGRAEFDALVARLDEMERKYGTYGADKADGQKPDDGRPAKNGSR